MYIIHVFFTRVFPLVVNDASGERRRVEGGDSFDRVVCAWRRSNDSADGYNVELHAKVGKGRQLNLERFQSLVRITDRLMANDDASGGVSASSTRTTSADMD